MSPLVGPSARPPNSLPGAPNVVTAAPAVAGAKIASAMAEHTASPQRLMGRVSRSPPVRAMGYVRTPAPASQRKLVLSLTGAGGRAEPKRQMGRTAQHETIEPPPP